MTSKPSLRLVAFYAWLLAGVASKVTLVLLVAFVALALTSSFFSPFFGAYSSS